MNGFGVPWSEDFHLHFLGKIMLTEFETVALPALSVGKEVPFVESLNHARFLDKTYPELPTLLPEGAEEAPIHFRELYAGPWQSLFRLLVVAIVTNVLNPPSAEHFRRTKEARFGVSLETVSGEEGSKEREQLWSDLEEGLIPLAALLGDKEGVLFQGHTPTFIDVEFVGFLSWANRSDEAVFHRILKLDPKFKLLWDATPEWRSRTGL